MSKRNPEDVLKDIEQSAVDDEVERVLAMSPEERRKELEAAGYTAAELDAKADALFERFQQAGLAGEKKKLEEAGRAKSLGPPAQSGRRTLLLIAAAFVVILVALLFLPSLTSRQVTPLAVPSATAPTAPTAPPPPLPASSPSASSSAVPRDDASAPEVPTGSK